MDEEDKEDKWHEAYPDKELREMIKFNSYFFRRAELRIRKEQKKYYFSIK
jgi:hypothetical protein